MMRLKRNNKKIIICVTVFLCICLPIIYYNTINESIKSLLLGIISSIVASLVFNFFSEAVFDDRHKEIEELQSITKTLVESQTKGILSIRGRNEFEQDFWISFMLETNEKLVLSGRTLNRWLEGSMQKLFEENLKRILQNNGDVTFVIYKNLPTSEEQAEKERLHEFLENNIFPVCVQKSQKNGNYKMKKGINLNIIEIDILPYLYNSNESCIIVAPYFKYVDNSNNIMFILKRDCKYGLEYIRDFEKIIANGEKNLWFTKYLKSKNEEVQKGRAPKNSSGKKEVNGDENNE